MKLLNESDSAYGEKADIMIIQTVIDSETSAKISTWKTEYPNINLGQVISRLRVEQDKNAEKSKVIEKSISFLRVFGIDNV